MSGDVPSTICQSLAEFRLLISVCKHDNEVECRIYRWWVKTHLQFEAICEPKFISFRHDVGDPLWFAIHFAAYVYPVSFRRYRPLKLQLSCKVVEKRWLLGPRFVGGCDTPDFGHAVSNRTHLRACARFWLSC